MRAARVRAGELDLVAEIVADTAGLVGARTACAGRPELFEPSSTSEPHEQRTTRRADALALCHRCPGLTACRAWSAREPRSRWAGWVIGGRLIPTSTAAPAAGAAS